MRPGLTMADARDLDYETLVERVEDILADYDAPEVETEHQKIQRLSRTLDEMPQLYRLLLQLHSWIDHWTDATADMFGRGDKRYKSSRERRDFFEDQASAAKMRYESASRLITVIMGFDPTGMPRQRRGD